MKIMIIQPWIKQGGAELISVHLAYELAKQGHKVQIVCLFVDLAGMPHHARHVCYVTPPTWLSDWLARSRLAFLFLGPFVLFNLVWKYAGDIDVLNPHNFPASWIAVMVGKLRRIPIVWTCNEPP